MLSAIYFYVDNYMGGSTFFESLSLPAPSQFLKVMPTSKFANDKSELANSRTSLVKRVKFNSSIADYSDEYKFEIEVQYGA